MRYVYKTDIEWVKNPEDEQKGHAWNPLTGCLNQKNGICKQGGFPCYAYKVANGRVKNLYLNNKNVSTYVEAVMNWNEETRFDNWIQNDPFYPRYWHNKVMSHVIHKSARPLGIFCCDMSDLFGIGIPEKWIDYILLAIKHNPQNRYYLLTKQAKNMKLYSPFTDNVWAGVTVTNQKALEIAAPYIMDIKAPVKFLSIEPLLSPVKIEAIRTTEFEHVDLLLGNIHGVPPRPSVINKFDKRVNWLIIGACTGTKKDLDQLKTQYPDLTLMPYGKKWTLQPPIKWVREIVEAADNAGTPVFLKNNLWPLIRSSYLPLWAYDSKRSNEDDGLFLRQEQPE